MILNETMNEIADAIREKTGKSEKIAPINFAEEIKSISAGGGESGGSNVEYWDITAAPEAIYEIAQFATLLKYIRSERKSIGSMYSLKLSNITPIAVAIDMNLKMANTNGEVKAVSEIFKDLGFPSFDTIGWKQITEAEFYDLNA